MNKTQPFNEITIIFDNYENIIVDSRALRFLNFIGGQQRFTFKNNELHYQTELTLLTLGISADNMEYFRHPVGDIGIDRGKFRPDANKTDGENCFERLKSSDDISVIKINGTEYCVPWNDKKYSNDWQTNTMNNDEKYLAIKVKQPLSSEDK